MGPNSYCSFETVMNINGIPASLSPWQHALKMSVISIGDKSQALLVALWCVLSIHNREKCWISARGQGKHRFSPQDPRVRMSALEICYGEPPDILLPGRGEG